MVSGTIFTRPGIQQAYEAGKSYRDIRDTIRLTGSPEDLKRSREA